MSNYVLTPNPHGTADIERTRYKADSLLSGREFSESPGNSGLRERLALEYDTLGGEKMLERLASVDPARAARLSANDKKRIVRALEIYALTGRTITEHDELSKLAPKPYRTFKVFLNSEDRGFLYDRIEKRVDRMFEAGLPDEVKSLLDEGVSPECTSMQAIGYKETVLAIRGDCSIDEAKASIKQGSRRYAKRQLTWFNRYTDAFRLDLGADPDLAEAAETVCGMFELLFWEPADEEAVKNYGNFRKRKVSKSEDCPRRLSLRERPKRDNSCRCQQDE